MTLKDPGGHAHPTRWQLRFLEYLALALQVSVVVLLGVVLALDAGPAGLRYVLVALAALGLGALLVRFLAGRGQDQGLGVLLCRQLAATADPATALFQAIGTLRQALRVERVALFAIDGRLRQAELLAESHQSGGEGVWAGTLPLERLPRLAEVVQTRRPAFYPAVAALNLPAESKRLLAANLPSCCLYPLQAGEMSVGFLALASAHPRRLERLSREAGLARAADVLALYIRTANLQPDALRAQDQIELLYEVTTHLNADLSLEKVMTNVLTQAMAKVGATRGSVFLLDEQGRVTDRILCRENLAPEVSSLVIREIMERGLAAWVLEHKEGALIEDTLQDSRWMVLPDHAGHVRSAVAVPFLRHGQVQGMLFLTHPEVGRFRQEHLDLLTSIANQAAIAIQNARLYEWAENERRMLAAVLDSSADAILVTDPEDRIVLTNRAACQALGIENRPAPLRQVLMHPDLLALLERACQEEGIVNESVRLADNRTFSVSVAPVRDREGRTIGRVAVAHDITHMVELDEMKSRFVATVSHDLKAPLTAIRGFAELIKAVGPLNEDQSEFVQRIRDVVEGMTRLISSLLDLGRIEAGLGIELQPVDLGNVMIQAKYDLALAAQEKDILVDVELPPSLPLVQGDPFRLHQVLTNLLGNAIKYTPRGGHVWIEAEVLPSEVVVSVRDTGIGIPPADLPHVFEKFYRVQDARVADQEGSGLGLAIVKSIIGELGGRVWAESTLNKGSTFFFALPLAGS